MDNRPTSEYAQPGSHHHPPTDASSEQKPADPTAATHYTPQSDVQPANISSSHTPHSADYGLNTPSTTRSPYQDYHPLRAPYAPNSQPGGGAGMAQATSPFHLPTGPRSPIHKSDAPVAIDPSLPANSPTYPPAYSPFQPQGHQAHQAHEMQYPGQGPPPPPHHMYGHGRDWPPGYGQPQLQGGYPAQGPYASPATTVGSTSPTVSAKSRPGQVCF